MAISVSAFGVQMTDAEFLTINGAVANGTNFPVSSPFYGIGIGAGSASGVTTIYFQTMSSRGVEHLLSRLRRSAQTFKYTFV